MSKLTIEEKWVELTKTIELECYHDDECCNCNILFYWSNQKIRDYYDAYIGDDDEQL